MINIIKHKSLSYCKDFIKKKHSEMHLITKRKKTE